MILDNKIKILLLLLAVLISSALYFGVIPVLSKIKSNSEQIVAQKNKIKDFQIKNQVMGESEDYLRKIFLDADKAVDVFIDGEVPVEFLRFLEKTARDCNVAMDISLSSTPKVKEEKWPHLFFQINSIGFLPDFLRFFEKLENCPYLIDIQSLSVNRLSDENLKSKEYEGFSSGSVTATISVKVYSK